MKKLKVILVLLGIAIVATLFVILKFSSPTNLVQAAGTRYQETKQGQSAPDFDLSDIYGKKVRLSDFKGKVVILNFWATWCPPCRKAIPDFNELYTAYHDKGLEIIGISLDENQSSVKPFSEKKGIRYIVVLGDEDTADLFGGITGVPINFIIDREGAIRKRFIGDPGKDVLEEELKKYL